MSLVGYSNKKKQSQLTVLDHTLAGPQTFMNLKFQNYRVFIESRHKVNAYLWKKKIFLIVKIKIC